MGEQMHDFDEEKCLRQITENVKEWDTAKITRWLEVMEKYDKTGSDLSRRMVNIVKTELDSRVNNA